MRYLFFALLGVFLITNCQKAPISNFDSETPILPSTNYDYNSTKFAFDPIDNDLATLGRVLFYDKKLSLNNRVSCGSCHIQSLGFADNKALSEGFSGMSTLRNSLAIINLNRFNSLFWDARENILDSMVVQPILNHIEMGISNLSQIESRIQKYSYYNALFFNAFGDNKIDKDRIGKALAEFVKSIRNSDEFELKIKTIHNSEGGRLFAKYQCSNCHQVGSIVNTSWGADFANTGLDLVDKDLGAGAVLNKHGNQFNGAFKIPSLINVGLSAPYMHDGRFKTLEEVIDHYSHGISPNKNLDFRLREGFDNLIFNTNVNFSQAQMQISQDQKVIPRQANITEKDKKILVDFLKSLTDDKLVKDKKYSNPFLN